MEGSVTIFVTNDIMITMQIILSVAENLLLS
jgi:hypothetical protein